jgi:hypothetical protein
MSASVGEKPPLMDNIDIKGSRKLTLDSYFLHDPLLIMFSIVHEHRPHFLAACISQAAKLKQRFIPLNTEVSNNTRVDKHERTFSPGLFSILWRRRQNLRLHQGGLRDPGTLYLLTPVCVSITLVVRSVTALWHRVASGKVPTLTPYYSKKPHWPNSGLRSLKAE